MSNIKENEIQIDDAILRLREKIGSDNKQINSKNFLIPFLIIHFSGLISGVFLIYLVDKLTINYNRSRQASITKELIEIISGAESL